jgi:hypothetical protein
MLASNHGRLAATLRLTKPAYPYTSITLRPVTAFPDCRGELLVGIGMLHTPRVQKCEQISGNVRRSDRDDAHERPS